MLNRRHLRIKVLQILYAFFQSKEIDVVKAQNELLLSVERMYDLYLYLLLTIPELKRAAETNNENRKNKLRPNESDLMPNLKWVENSLVLKIEESKELNKLSSARKVNWLGAENQEIFRKMFLQVKDSETYFEFMENGLKDFEEDKKFALALFKNEIINSEFLHNYIEDKSIYWLDDIDLCCSMALKTLKTVAPDKEISILSLYKEDDDEKEFILNLCRNTIEMDVENEKLIEVLAVNWEVDRIAKMDVLLLKMALVELQTCSNIPTKVTMNEYIEISKFYSTPKSNLFINGILDKAISQLSKEKKIKKIGRGLIN
ncbi:MAG: transcription antitermination protein NusB [Crocinitomicaceae bacterium]|jgi:N utilization substance protein B|nr:transcription antitermination protein NusB [Flavobacteriia bacterium]NDC27928.1 transcription antitermination protein NusB [Crocinitomicaceae bacterium]NDC92344.1 transcription antitermination protein NusB [Flavobacteriales bacterium]